MRKLDLTRRWLALACIAGATAHSRAADSDSIDVWVELTERPPAPDAAASASRRQSERVAMQQERVAAALSRLGGVELARTHASANAIAVRIDRVHLDAVRALPDVKRVRPARKLHPPRTGGPA